MTSETLSEAVELAKKFFDGEVTLQVDQLVEMAKALLSLHEQFDELRQALDDAHHLVGARERDLVKVLKEIEDAPVVYYMETEGSPFMHKTTGWPGDNRKTRLVRIEEIKK